MIPPIPNDLALLVALQELQSTLKLESTLNVLDYEGGAFLEPYISDLKSRIQEYVPREYLPKAEVVKK